MNHRFIVYGLSITGLLFSVQAADRSASAPSGPVAYHHDTLSEYDSVSLSPVVVTAARRELQSRWVSDDHTIIDAGRTSIASVRSASELLAENIPAFISDYGGGGAKKISLRGAGSERTLVLVDGKRTGTSDNDLSDIPASIVQKIEVVEGGQSALYGMDAIGGVVNVITKKPKHDGFSGSYSSMVGSYEPSGSRSAGLNSMTHQASVAMKKGVYEGMASGDWRASDGRYDYRMGEGVYAPRDSNESRDMNLFGRMGRTFDRIEVNATGSIADRRVNNPGTIFWPSPGTTRKRLNAGGIDAAWHTSGMSVLRMNAVLGNEIIRYNNYDTLMPQNSRHRRWYGDMDLVQEFTLGKQLLTAGLTARRQYLESNEIGNHGADEFSAFACGVGTHTAGFFTIKATPSVRFDYSNIYGSAFNGKAGVIAGLATAGEPCLFANVGTAKRAPTFNDLYWPKDAWSVGNQNLRPERSVNFDAGFQVHHRAGKLIAGGRVSGYSMTLQDMILWQPDPGDPDGMRWKPDNVAEAKIRGIHGSAEVSYAKEYSSRLGITWNDARDTATGKVLIYRPEYLLTYGNELAVDPFYAGITCRFMSEVYTNAENTDRLPESTIFDCTIGVKLAAPFEFKSGIVLEYDLYNLTNELRCTNNGYPLPGREHRISVRVSF